LADDVDRRDTANTIRAKTPPRHTFQVDLQAGSLLVMDYATQIHYTHAAPKDHRARR
jgi:hypothetical protein